MALSEDDIEKDIELRIAAQKCAEDIGVAAVSDPAAFWEALHPHQILALLQAAPAVLGPWTVDVERSQARRIRYVVGGEDTTGAYAYGNGDRSLTLPDKRDRSGYWRTYVAADPSRGNCATLADGMAAADAALRAKGWLLVEGKVER